MAERWSIVRRAAAHAALGEPVRLRLVDHLVLGDASPGELGALVRLSTNLLAHHLNVLEKAGILRRVRSEGDGRRSYVQLCADDPDVAALLSSSPIVAPSAARVVFVCTRNSARSQLAAAVWARTSPVPATSAGTHPADRVHPRAVAAAHRHGLTVPRWRTRAAGDVIEPTDLVVAVCDQAHEELVATDRPRLHWAVPDPVRIDTDAAFDDAYDAIAERVARLAAALTPTGG